VEDQKEKKSTPGFKTGAGKAKTPIKGKQPPTVKLIRPQKAGNKNKEESAESEILESEPQAPNDLETNE